MQVNRPDMTSHLDAASGQSLWSVTVGAAAAGLRAGDLPHSDIARLPAVHGARRVQAEVPSLFLRFGAAADCKFGRAGGHLTFTITGPDPNDVIGAAFSAAVAARQKQGDTNNDD